jgi:hypothetical protein
MKKFIITFFLFASCVSKKTGENHLETSTTKCPENFECTLETKENQSLSIQYDDLGRLSYELTPDKNKTVVIYKINKIVPKNIQDGSYREEILLELHNKNEALLLENDNLQKSKLIFGRFCYCKGKTGYYKITSGKLDIKNSKLNLTFKIFEVPQLLNTINIVLPK